MPNTETPTSNPIDPLFGKPHDNISGITDGNHRPVGEILSHTDEQVRNLHNLTSDSESSGNRFSVRRALFAGALTVGALVYFGGAEKAGDIFSDIATRIDQNLDSHNLPQGGEPVEFRGGTPYEPGTDTTVELPPVVVTP